MSLKLSTPQSVNDFWFGDDRSAFNSAAHIGKLMSKWFGGSVPEVEATFVAESSQIEKVADESNLDEKWFTPEGKLRCNCR